MMDSGKALARSGELLVDLTTELGLYGGALSAAGAQIRNAGDAVAQAAASCRFKTGAELVTDELREGATCLAEVVGKMTQAVEEAEQDQDKHLQTEIGTYLRGDISYYNAIWFNHWFQSYKTNISDIIRTTYCISFSVTASAIRHVEVCSKSLEAAGAGIMKKLPVSDIGVNLVACGESMKLLSASIQALAPDTKEAKESSQRMMFAADQMIVAGNELQGKSEKPKGKAWLKG